MDNILKPGSQNEGLEEKLQSLPDSISIALKTWRKATLDKKKLHAEKYMEFRVGSMGKRMVGEIEAMIDRDGDYYAACLNEASAESEYKRLNESLMAEKALARLRTAF